MRGEYAENTFRKDFLPSEGVEIGSALEKLFAAEAKAAQLASLKQNASRGGNLPPREPGKTRDKIAEVVGMSGRTHEKAKEVVKAAAEEPEIVAHRANSS